MGIYALAAKKLTAAVNGRLKAKPRNGAQRRTTAQRHTTAPLCRCSVVRRCVVSTDRVHAALCPVQIALHRYVLTVFNESMNDNSYNYFVDKISIFAKYYEFGKTNG